MTAYKYDPDLPYAVESLGQLKARARFEDEAEQFAEHYLDGKVIDTTPASMMSRSYRASSDTQTDREQPAPEWEYAHSASGYWTVDETEFIVEDYYDVTPDPRGAIAKREVAGPWESVA